jgi:hypothetical protein
MFFSQGLVALINQFDSNSIRLVVLHREQSELLGLALRKHTEMMNLRQSCLQLRMEMEYLNRHGWNTVLQHHQDQAITQTTNQAVQTLL